MGIFQFGLRVQMLYVYHISVSVPVYIDYNFIQEIQQNDAIFYIF